MLSIPMIITKDVQRRVKLDYFFVKGKLEIDSNYFIQKIKDSVTSNNNMNYRTNIKGKMTPYNFFVQDKKFIELVTPLIDYVDEIQEFQNYHLANAWGYELEHREKTIFHDHFNSLWSGAIYLNNCNQPLKFPQINEEVLPEKGSFVIFSGFLNHGCEKNNDTSKFGMSFNFDMNFISWYILIHPNIIIYKEPRK